MAKIKYIIILILPLIFFSCGQNKVKKVKFPSGKMQYKYFFTRNHIDSVYEYFEQPNKIKSITKILSDSTQYIVMLDKHGKKKAEGGTVLRNGRYVRNGWWNEKNNTLSKIEYLPIGDSVIINQSISYNRNNEIDNNNSLFYKIDLPDTVEFGKEYLFNVKLFTRVGDKNVFISKLKLSDEINSDFTNISNSESNYDVKEINMNHWRVKHSFMNKKGNKVIKGGIYVRMFWGENINADSVRFNTFEKILYIKKTIYVK